MRNIILVVITAAAFLFTGCSHEQVKSGEVGKILTKNGFAPEVLSAGTYKVCGVFDFTCYNTLIKMDSSEHQFIEVVTTRMKDNLNLKADHIRVRVTLSPKKSVINALFNQIKPDTNNYISMEKIYNTYGKLVVTRDVREVLSKYTIDDVRLNYARISAEIYQKVKKDFKATPLILLDFSVGRFIYPKSYEKMVQLSKEKEVEIKKIEAENIIKMKKAQAAIKLAKANYAIKMQEAKRIADFNKLVGQSVTNKLLELRKLEVQEKMVNNLQGNPNVVYMPYEMMNSTMIYQLPNPKNQK